MPIAYKSDQETKTQNVPLIQIGPSELGGRLRVAHFNVLTSAIVYPGDTVDLITLPQSARVLGGEIKFEDMSTDITETADTDYFVESTNMKVGAYTLAHTAPLPAETPRKVTVTQTAVGAEDTNGTIDIVGTDAAGAALTETITPNAGVTVAGVKYFRTITSITGVGWVINEGNDTIIVGYAALTGVEAAIEIGTSSDPDHFLASTPMTTAGVASFANTIALNYGERLSALNATKVIARNPLSESEPWAAAKKIDGFIQYVVD